MTVEEAKERREKMAKMRSLLFAHEQKAKRLKAVKSKGFHRHAKKAAKMKVQQHIIAKPPCLNAEQARAYSWTLAETHSITCCHDFHAVDVHMLGFTLVDSNAYQ